MGFFNRKLEEAVKIQAEIIEEITEEYFKLLKKFWKCIEKPHRVKWAFITIINNSKFIIMDLSLNENQFSVAQNALFDLVTGNQIPDAVFTNLVMSSSDETVATVSVLADGTVQVNGVNGGPGEAPSRIAVISGKSNVTYTNSLGESSTGQLLITVNVTVLAVQTADGVEWRLIFGAPQLQVV